MKIDAVDVTLFAWDDIPPTKYGRGTQNMSGRSNLGLLRIKTDSGLEGHAFLGAATNPAESDAATLIRVLKPVLMGADPLARDELHAAMRARQRTTGLRAIGACDTALWDVAAKAAGMPLCKFLGGGRSAIGAYASSQILDGTQAYAGEAAQFKADGWKAYKIHPPQNPDEDIKVCEAVRKAVGDDYTLMLDSTWSYRYHDAVRVGRAIERLGFLWFEDPLNEEDIYSYVKLRQKLDIPIMATEYPSGDIGTYAVWLTERATDYLRGDIPGRAHHHAQDRAPRRGLPHDLRGAPRRQLAQQHGTAALRLCNSQYDVLRGAAAARCAQVRPAQRHPDRQGRAGALPADARHRRRDRFRADCAQADRRAELSRRYSAVAAHAGMMP